MKIALYVAAGAVLLVVIVAVIGAMLPVKHHATRRARFQVAPDALYSVLAGPPDWRTGVKAFGLLPDENGHKRWWEEDTHHQKITYELIDAQPARRLQTRIATPNLPFGGTWTFDISSSDQGAADLRITEDGEVYNVIFRFMARYIFGHHASIETYLKDLGVKFNQEVVWDKN
jgi:uncharacterized protein YndB with AHSA1/START domain